MDLGFVVPTKHGKILKPGKVRREGDRLYLSFPYSEYLIKEIKAMSGAKWHPEAKQWSIDFNERNRFQLAYLSGSNPYARWEKPLTPVETKRPLYRNQRDEMLPYILGYKWVILACEMGTGKSLACLEAAEQVGCLDADSFWYIGPRAGVYAVSRELVKWKSPCQPRMMTYETNVRVMREPGLLKVPRFVWFDESQKIKTHSSQRGQAGKELADRVRAEWGEDSYIILTTGTPAPKSPLDWWHQCETACPGFLREGTPQKFKARLCLIEQREGITGVYPHIVTWLDDERKCSVCGEMEDHEKHRDAMFAAEGTKCHIYSPSVNEIKKLYERMRGLVLVQFKKDCLDLPELTYETITVKPTVDILRAAKLIKAQAGRVIESLTNLRELSDGFLYKETVSGKRICSLCKGRGEITAKDQVTDTKVSAELTEKDFVDTTDTCPNCNGSGEEDVYERTTQEIDTPKMQVFIDDLDEYEGVGRYVAFAAFTASVDRLVQVAHKQGWATLRIDGRGLAAENAKGEPIDVKECFSAMDASDPRRKELLEKYPNLTVIANAGSGSMAYTFTASPIALFYSNSFRADDRIQAEARIHRAGMDTNRACIIKDVVMFQTDQLVLDNLRKKKDLQNLTLGELSEAMKGLL